MRRTLAATPVDNGPLILRLRDGPGVVERQLSMGPGSQRLPLFAQR